MGRTDSAQCAPRLVIVAARVPHLRNNAVNVDCPQCGPERGVGSAVGIDARREPAPVRPGGEVRADQRRIAEQVKALRRQLRWEYHPPKRGKRTTTPLRRAIDRAGHVGVEGV